MNKTIHIFFIPLSDLIYKTWGQAPHRLKKRRQIPSFLQHEYIEVKGGKRRKKHPGRNAVPENIETVIHNVDLTVEEKQCVNGCGEFVKIREEQRTIIELEPAKYVKHIYIQPVYGCKTFKDALVLKEMPLVSPLPRIKCCSHTSFMWVYVNGE